MHLLTSFSECKPLHFTRRTPVPIQVRLGKRKSAGVSHRRSGEVLKQMLERAMFLLHKHCDDLKQKPQQVSNVNSQRRVFGLVGIFQSSGPCCTSHAIRKETSDSGPRVLAHLGDFFLSLFSEAAHDKPLAWHEQPSTKTLEHRGTDISKRRMTQQVKKSHY